MLISWDITGIFYEVTYTCYIQIPGASEIQNTGHRHLTERWLLQSVTADKLIYIYWYVLTIWKAL